MSDDDTKAPERKELVCAECGDPVSYVCKKCSGLCCKECIEFHEEFCLVKELQ